MKPRLYQPSEKRMVSTPSFQSPRHLAAKVAAGPLAMAIPKMNIATPRAPMRFVSATATSASTATASRKVEGARR